jgi:tetratricopeptide (TPR) repeat protein
MATAANAYQAILQVRDRKKAPMAWAATQNNLGSVLFLLGKKAKNPERIEAAIDAFEAALEVYELRRKHRQAAVTGKNLDRARDLLEHMVPKNYLSRELMELDVPLNENPSADSVDVSDISADRSGGSAVH